MGEIVDGKELFNTRIKHMTRLQIVTIIGLCNNELRERDEVLVCTHEYFDNGIRCSIDVGDKLCEQDNCKVFEVTK